MKSSPNLDADTIKSIVDQVVERMKDAQSSEAVPGGHDSGQQVNEDSDFHAILDDAITDRHESLGQLHPDIQFTGLPLGAALKPATKLAIWDGKYVDFQLLQDDAADDDKFVLHANADSSFAIRKNTRGKKIATFEQWLQSFLVFASVMTEKFPGLAPDLFKYLSLIQAMSARIGGLAWFEYDKQFRKLKQVDPAKCWGKLDSETHLMAIMPLRNQPFRAPLRNQSKGDTPAGYCFHFSKGVPCPRSPACQYKHRCHKCQGNHPAKSCYTSSGGSIKPATAKHAEVKPPATSK